MKMRQVCTGLVIVVTVPSASRISRQIDSKSALPTKPVRGLNAPMAIISRSHASVRLRVIAGSDAASAAKA